MLQYVLSQRYTQQIYLFRMEEEYEPLKTIGNDKNVASVLSVQTGCILFYFWSWSMLNNGRSGICFLGTTASDRLVYIRLYRL